MRSFEQRMAEIHRRREKLIQKRNMRRKRLLGLCIPAVCVGLCGVLMLPAGVRSGKMPGNDGYSAAPESAGSHKDHSIAENDGRYHLAKVSVSLSDSLASRSYTDPAVLNRVLMAVDAAMCGESALGSLPDGVEGEDDATKSQATQSMDTGKPNGSTSYTLCLTCNNGAVFRYRLRGSTLTDCQTGGKYTVPAEELELLLSVLEIDG